MSSTKLMALVASALIPHLAFSGDMVGKDLRKSVGTTTVRLVVERRPPDFEGLSVPYTIHVQNPSPNQTLCFDRIQVRGLGDGKQSFMFSIFQTASGQPSATPQNKTEPPPLKTDAYWRTPPGAGTAIGSFEFRNLDWVAASAQQIHIRLMFNPAPGRSGCTAPPSEVFVFNGK